MNKSTLLARLRLERMRQYFQQAAVEDDLAEEFDDFDETVDRPEDAGSDLY